MSFPRYPKYKDSCVEWLGEVPESWEISRLSFESWVRARLGWKGLKAEEYVDQGFAFLSTPNIKNSEIDFEHVNFISRERFDESPEIKIRKGDILLAKDGSTLGTVNVVRDLPRPTTVNSSIAVITPSSRLNGIFLFYFFTSSYMVQTIQKTKGGMGVPHLFQSDINKFYLPIPPFFEQTQIAKFLDREIAKLDELVAEQQRLIELLKEKRQAVISHAVTKGLNPKAPMKPSGIEWLGDVPAHWEVKRLKSLGTITSGYAFSSSDFSASGIRVLKIANIQTSKIDWTDDSYLPRDFYAQYTRFALRNGDVVFALTRPIISRGLKAAVIEIEDDLVLLNQRNAMFRPFEGFDKRFIYQVLFSISFLAAFENKIDFTGQQPNISPIDIGNISIPVPPPGEQVAVAEYLGSVASNFNTLTAEAQRAIDLLQERRTALISAAVTGQIDVRNQ